MENANREKNEATLTIVREFNAPRELVFEAFSDAAHLGQWWGPVGSRTTVVSLDFRPKGLFHYKMESDMGIMWGRFIYGQIKKPELIEFTLSISDEKAGITRAPFPGFEQWPLEIFNIFTFTEKGGKTTITSKSYPVNATEEEIKCFIGNMDSFREGTTATLAQLDVYFSRLGKDSDQ